MIKATNNYFYSMALLMLLSIDTYGQSPDWTIDTSQYEYSMTFVVCLNNNGTTLSKSNDKVGAFVNGLLRGSSNLYYISSADRFLAYLVVYANKNDETITFKIYDSTSDQVLDTSNTVTFKIDDIYGDANDPFCIETSTLTLNEFDINSMNIIPNPFYDAIQIKLPSNLNNTWFTANIYDLNGRLLYEKLILSSDTKLHLTDLYKLAKGPYLLKIKNYKDGIVHTKKLLKY
jgi:hypothetical protein